LCTLCSIFNRCLHTAQYRVKFTTLPQLADGTLSIQTLWDRSHVMLSPGPGLAYLNSRIGKGAFQQDTLGAVVPLQVASHLLLYAGYPISPHHRMQHSRCPVTCPRRAQPCPHKPVRWLIQTARPVCLRCPPKPHCIVSRAEILPCPLH
jgi:hypothetical protein